MIRRHGHRTPDPPPHHTKLAKTPVNHARRGSIEVAGVGRGRARNTCEGVEGLRCSNKDINKTVTGRSSIVLMV